MATLVEDLAGDAADVGGDVVWYEMWKKDPQFARRMTIGSLIAFLVVFLVIAFVLVAASKRRYTEPCACPAARPDKRS